MDRKSSSELSLDEEDPNVNLTHIRVRHGSADSHYYSLNSLSNLSDTEGVDVAKKKAKTKKTKESSSTKNQDEKSTKTEKRMAKGSGSTSNVFSSDEDLPKASKRKRGVLERIRKFGSREELDYFSHDEVKSKKKEKKKEKRKDSSERVVAVPSEEGGSKVHISDVIALPQSRTTTKSRKFSEGSSSDDEEFARDVLAVANRYRRSHGVKKLRANKELNVLAYQWANMLARKKSVQERKEKKYGKNFYSKPISSPDEKVTAEEVVGKWYLELKDYDFEADPETIPSLKNGTQLLWKDSRYIGVAKSKTSSRDFVFVAAYFTPPGNILGKFRTQVPPMGGFEKQSSSDNTSSSEDDSEKTKEIGQEVKHHEKTGKKTLFSQMLNKLRRSSEGDIDQAKKKEGKHSAGHKHGKYVPDVTEPASPISGKSSFYIVTPESIKESKQNLRSTKYLSSESIEIDISTEKVSIAYKREKSFSSSSDDNEQKAESEIQTKIQIEKNDSLTEEVLSLLTYPPPKSKNGEASKDSALHKEARKVEENKQGKFSITKHENKSDTSSDEDERKSRMYKGTEISEVKERHPQTTENDTTSYDRVLTENTKYSEMKPAAKNSVVTDKPKKIGALTKLKGYLGKKTEYTLPVAENCDAKSGKNISVGTSSLIDQSYHMDECKKDSTNYNTRNEPQHPPKKTSKGGIFSKLKGKRHTDKETDAISSSDEDEAKNKISLKKNSSEKQIIYQKPNGSEDKSEEIPIPNKPESKNENKSKESSSSDEEEEHKEIATQGTTSTKQIYSDRPEKMGVFGKIKHQLKRNTEHNVARSNNGDISKVKEDNGKSASGDLHVVGKSEGAGILSQYADEAKDKPSSSEDETKNKENMKEVSKIHASAEKPKKLGVIGKLKERLEKKGDTESSSDDERNEKKTNVEKSFTSNENPKNSTEMPGKYRVISAVTVNRDESSSSDANEDKMEVQKGNHLSGKESVTTKPQTPAEESKNKGIIVQLTSGRSEKNKESSSSDENEDKMKVQKEKATSGKESTPTKPQTLTEEPKKRGFFVQFTSKHSEKTEESSSSDENEDKVKAQKVKATSGKEIMKTKPQTLTEEPENKGLFVQLSSRNSEKNKESSSSSDENEEKEKLHKDKVISVKQDTESKPHKTKRTRVIDRLTGAISKKAEESSSSDNEGPEMNIHKDNLVSIKENSSSKPQITSDESKNSEILGKLNIVKSKTAEEVSSSDEDKHKNEKHKDVSGKENTPAKQNSPSNESKNLGFFGKLIRGHSKASEGSSSSDENDDKMNINIETTASFKENIAEKPQIPKVASTCKRNISKITGVHSLDAEQTSSSSDDETKNKNKKENNASLMPNANSTTKQIPIDEQKNRGFFTKLFHREKAEESSSSDEDDAKAKMQLRTGITDELDRNNSNDTKESSKDGAIKMKRNNDSSVMETSEIKPQHPTNGQNNRGIISILTGSNLMKAEECSSSSEDEFKREQKIGNAASLQKRPFSKPQTPTDEPKSKGFIAKMTDKLLKEKESSSSDEDKVKNKIQKEKADSLRENTDNRPQKGLDESKNLGIFSKLVSDRSKNDDESSSSDEDKCKRQKNKSVSKNVNKQNLPQMANIDADETKSKGFIAKMTDKLLKEKESSSSDEDEKENKIQKKKADSLGENTDSRPQRANDESKNLGIFSKLVGDRSKNDDERSSSDEDECKRQKNKSVSKNENKQNLPQIANIDADETKSKGFVAKMTDKLLKEKESSSSDEDADKIKAQNGKVDTVNENIINKLHIEPSEPKSKRVISKLFGGHSKKTEESSTSNEDEDEDENKFQKEKVNSLRKNTASTPQIDNDESKNRRIFSKLMGNRSKNDDDSSSSDEDEDKRRKYKSSYKNENKQNLPQMGNIDADEPKKKGYIAKMTEKLLKEKESSSSDEDVDKIRGQNSKTDTVHEIITNNQKITTGEPQNNGVISKLFGGNSKKTVKSSTNDEDENESKNWGIFSKLVGDESKIDDDRSSSDEEGKRQKNKSGSKNEKKQSLTQMTNIDADEPNKKGFLAKLIGRHSDKSEGSSSSDDDADTKKIKLSKASVLNESEVSKPQIITDDPKNMRLIEKLTYTHPKKAESSSSSDEDSDNIKEGKTISLKEINTNKPQIATALQPNKEIIGNLTGAYLGNRREISSSNDDGVKNNIQTDITVSVRENTTVHSHIYVDMSKDSGYVDKLASKHSQKTKESSSSDEEKNEKKVNEKYDFSLKVHETNDKPSNNGFLVTLIGGHSKTIGESTPSDGDNDKMNIQKDKITSVKERTTSKPPILTNKPQNRGLITKITSGYSAKTEESSTSEEDEAKIKVKTEMTTTLTEKTASSHQIATDDSKKKGVIGKIICALLKNDNESSSSSEDEDMKKIQENNDDSVRGYTSSISQIPTDDQKNKGFIARMTGRHSEKSKESSSSDESKNESTIQKDKTTKNRVSKLQISGDEIKNISKNIEKEFCDRSSSSDENIDKVNKFPEENTLRNVSISSKQPVNHSDSGQLNVIEKLKEHVIKSRDDDSSSDDDEGKMKTQDKKIVHVQITATHSSADQKENLDFLGKIKSQFQKHIEDSSSSSEDEQDENTFGKKSESAGSVDAITVPQKYFYIETPKKVEPCSGLTDQPDNKQLEICKEWHSSTVVTSSTERQVPVKKIVSSTEKLRKREKGNNSSSSDDDELKNETPNKEPVKGGFGVFKSLQENTVKKCCSSSGSSDEDKVKSNFKNGYEFSIERKHLHRSEEKFDDSPTLPLGEFKLHERISDKTESQHNSSDNKHFDLVRKPFENYDKSNESKLKTSPLVRSNSKECCPTESKSFVSTMIEVFENPSVKKSTSHSKKEFVSRRSSSIDFAETIVNKINFYRARHNAEKLQLDEELCSYAAERAKRYSSGIIGNIPRNLGENVYVFSSSANCFLNDNAANHVVENWYKNISYYDFGSEPEEFDSNSGPFTQLVWKGSERIGVGIHQNFRENKIFVVAVFSPGGNIAGHFREQVFPV